MRIDKQFHPPIAGDNSYRSAIPQPINVPMGVSIGSDLGAGVAKNNSSSARPSWSGRRGPTAERNILISCTCLSMLCVDNSEGGSLPPQGDDYCLFRFDVVAKPVMFYTCVFVCRSVSSCTLDYTLSNRVLD